MRLGAALRNVYSQLAFETASPASYAVRTVRMYTP